MEEALEIRLKLLIDNVESLIKKGLDFLERSKEATGDANDRKSIKIIYIKLQTAIERFVADLHHYFKLVQTPSADILSTYTTIQIRAEEVAVELDLTFNLKNQDEKGGTSPQYLQSTVTSKLPKMELARFNGSILKWHEFWDQFESNIDQRNLKDVDKLLYLQSVLDGDAKRAIEGLDTTNRNYQIAVSTLKERYGKHGTVVDAHYKALINGKVADKTVVDYRRTFNELERHLRVLSSLGEDVNHSCLRVIIMQKFPEDLIYELRLNPNSESYSTNEVRKQIECIISAKELSTTLSEHPSTPNQDFGKYSLETLHVASGRQVDHSTRTNFASSNRDTRDRPRRYREHDNYTRKRPIKDNRDDKGAKKAKLICIFCGDGHFNDECTKFKTIRERSQQLEDRCYNCLGKGHRVAECQSPRKCYHCGKYGVHNRALCPSKEPVKANSLHVRELDRIRDGITVLQTAVVKVDHGNGGREQILRILLDCGSQRSYITKRVADVLCLPKLENNTLSVFTFGADRANDIESPLVQLDVITRTHNKIKIYANVVPHITKGIPTVPGTIKGDVLKEIAPEVVVLADDSSMGDQIDVLIGNDYYYSLMTGNKLKVFDDLYLVDSIFGWVWSGRYSAMERREDRLSVLTYFQSSIELNGFCKPDLPLQTNDLRKLWDLESIGIMDSPTASRDEEAISQFNRTTQYYDNRYHVKWPWIKFPPELPSNFGLAHGRLLGLLKRIDQETVQAYDNILKEQLDLGIIETVSEQRDTEHPIHYLPHHCIAKGDKLRLVYDASAKIQNNRSLNECLYRGPLLLKDLTGILIRFREHRVAVVADVEKAFLQVGLQEEDRDVTRFLWLRDITESPSPQNILQLRFRRVPFGIICSPFLLNAVIRYHLLKSNNQVCKQIADDIYVDNLVTGAESAEDALSLYHTARSAFNDLSMNLREWNSNSAQVMASIASEHKSKEQNSMKVLGLNWDLKKDTLRLRFEWTQEVEKRTVTKREILRLIASVFDPCGYAVPLILPAKLFLQTLWQEKVDWDTKFTEETLESSKSAIESLKLIQKIEIPRCVKLNMNSDDITSTELHVFTDSSIQAYAAVVYLRITYGTKTTTQFVIGKGRLAGKEQQIDLQIPKLELLGALIGSRLIQNVIRHIRLHITRLYLWTDSQIVICWCLTEKLLPPFVARRVEEIKRINNLQIRYVPTQLNPADAATRPNASIESIKRWLEGPDFLNQESEKWPSWPINLTETLTLNCSGGQGPTEISTEQENRSGSAQPSAKHDEQEGQNLNKEITIIDEDDSETDTYENEASIQHKLKRAQSECFKEEIKGVKTELGRSLGVYKDESGLLRCGGRLGNTDWSYGQKHPILLPRNHEVTSKIIEDTHRKNYHVGVPHTLSLVRKKYWIPKGRSQVQKVLRHCLPCRKHSGGPFKLPPMAPLPTERVTYSRPYTYT